MSVFPEIVRVRIINRNTGEAIPNIAVFIKLFAHRKNDYHFLLPLTNNNGITEVTKNWIIEEIKKCSNFFLMDYASGIEDCQPRFEFSVLDENQVRGAVRAQNLYIDHYPGIKREDIDSLVKADNYKYMPVSKTVELHGDKLIEVELSIEEVK